MTEPHGDDTIRRNITAPQDWWTAFLAAAAKEGKSLSEWLRDAGAAKLPKSIRGGLSRPRSEGRPRLER